MAVAPLFVVDRAALVAALRLTGAVSKDAPAIINGAIQEVRIGFFDCLTDTRVAEILTFPTAENPNTADERTRVKAEKTEVMWTRLFLITRLPNFFLDSSGDVPQAFNEEGLTREPRVDALTREINRLNAEILKRIDALKGKDACSIEDEVQATTIGPDVTPPLPFESIAPILLPAGVGRVQQLE